MLKKNFTTVDLSVMRAQSAGQSNAYTTWCETTRCSITLAEESAVRQLKSSDRGTAERYATVLRDRFLDGKAL